MPERVWVCGEGVNRTLVTTRCDNPNCCRAYVPESRALDAEAERNIYREKAEEWAIAEGKVRADLAALIPLARLGLLAVEMWGREEIGVDADMEGTAVNDEWNRRVACIVDTAATTAARIVLARHQEEAK